MTQADLVRLYFNKGSAYNSWDYCFNQQCPLAQECAHYLSVTYKNRNRPKATPSIPMPTTTTSANISCSCR